MVEPEEKDTENLLRRALERERRARALAEQVLEEKSLELYRAQEVLRLRVGELEKLNKELTESQFRLVQAEKLASLGTLVAGVGHEINNPVGFVTSNLSALGDYSAFLRRVLTAYGSFRDTVEVGDGDAVEIANKRLAAALEEDDLAFVLEDLGDLTAESLTGMDRIREIIDALRTFSRADDPEPVPYDVNSAVRNAIHIIGGELKSKCRIETNLVDLPLVSCFPGQINQVILNLLVNAADAVDRGGYVCLSTERTDDCVKIIVKDDGCGIDPEYVKRIYDPFFTTKPVGRGTGLGLAIVYDIVQVHNGTIEVDSVKDGGTSFTVVLPFGHHTAD